MKGLRSFTAFANRRITDWQPKKINALPFPLVKSTHNSSNEAKGTVGIVGAGISGLYAGLLLRKHNIPFRVFERCKHHIGGRIYTCREGFGGGENDYFEAGAMRIPCIPAHSPVFDLIDHLNKTLTSHMDKVELIDYLYTCEEGNLVYVNGKVQNNGEVMSLKYANDHPSELGFVGLKPEDSGKTAHSLMNDALKPLLQEFHDNRDAFFDKYDHISLQHYFTNFAEPKWYQSKVRYVETMTTATNSFTRGLIDRVIEYEDYHSHQSCGWKTIKNGMSRLPEACVKLIGKENITSGASVYKIEEEGDEVVVTYSTDGCVPSATPKREKFDKLLITIPNPALKMIDRPLWSAEKEEAMRACNVTPCYKLGLQFKTRFWEKGERPSYGGQSTTDTPSRWIVYPCYGLNDLGKGILFTYCWSTDALNVLPASDEQMVDSALRDIQKVYPDEDIGGLFTGNYKSFSWVSEVPMGVADFLPGQMKLLPSLQKNEGNVYFAGEHVSLRHAWIVGALDSACNACKQMFPELDLSL